MKDCTIRTITYDVRTKGNICRNTYLLENPQNVIERRSFNFPNLSVPLSINSVNVSTHPTA